METPRYRLSEPAVLRQGKPNFTRDKIDSNVAPGVDKSIRLFEAGAEVEYDGLPGPHMIPLNDEAKAALEANPPAPFVDFTRAMDFQKGDPLSGPTDGEIMAELRSMVSGRGRKGKVATATG